MGFQEFEASLVSTASPMPARDILIPYFNLKKRGGMIILSSRNGEETSPPQVTTEVAYSVPQSHQGPKHLSLSYPLTVILA